MTNLLFIWNYDIEGAPWRIAVTSGGAACLALPVNDASTLERAQKRLLHASKASNHTEAPEATAIIEAPCTAGHAAARQIAEYLAGSRRNLDFELWLTGTEFQQSVWRCLMRVPRGQCVTYGELARMCGHSTATRAVAAACAANSILIAIPCHRVIAAGGRLGGFSCGLSLKRRLLAIESPALPLFRRH